MELHTTISQVIERSYPLLNAISDFIKNEVDQDRWSNKEILGHLIDSAINNRARFVRYQITKELRFSGYAQDKWVAMSGYKDWQWNELLQGWYVRNKELAGIIKLIPKGVLDLQTSDHNLHQVAFKRVPEGEGSSLRYFITDYISHMEHHIKQIVPSYHRIITKY